MFRTSLGQASGIAAILIAGLAVAGPGLASDQESYVTVGADDGKAFLGVSTVEETESEEGGARITRVVDDSAADEAGLGEGDVVVGFDGRTIRGPLALSKRIQAHEPGDEVTITVVRDGRERSIDVELGERPGFAFIAPRVPDCDDDDDDCSFSYSCSGDDCTGLQVLRGLRRPMLGVQIVRPTGELRVHLGSDEEAGLLVSKIVPGSPAEDAGIAVGDLIVAVDGETIDDVGDIHRALEGKHGETVDVDVIRDGRPMTIGVGIPEPDDERPGGPRARLGAPGGCCGEAAWALGDARELAGRAAVLSDAAVRQALDQARAASRDSMARARRAYREALDASRTAPLVRDSIRRALGTYDYADVL